MSPSRRPLSLTTSGTSRHAGIEPFSWIGRHGHHSELREAGERVRDLPYEVHLVHREVGEVGEIGELHGQGRQRELVVGEREHLEPGELAYLSGRVRVREVVGVRIAKTSVSGTSPPQVAPRR